MITKPIEVSTTCKILRRIKFTQKLVGKLPEGFTSEDLVEQKRNIKKKPKKTNKTRGKRLAVHDSKHDKKRHN